MNEHEHTNCQEMLASLSDYVDGMLSETLCGELNEHLRGCKNCRVVVDTVRKTIELFHHDAEEDAMPPSVKERLYQKLDLQDYLRT